MSGVSTKKIIIAASGTGGHIYPGISLAREFESKGYKAVFFISNNATSVKILENSGFEHIAFNMTGMPRKASPSFVKFLFRLTRVVFQSKKKIKEINPDAIIGTGGYISVPVTLAAKMLGKKTYIHEQNAMPGAANKFLSKIVNKVFISFKDSAKYFGGNTVLSGYPVRADILNASKNSALKKFNFNKDVFTILVFGGSLGAVKLNEVAFEALDKLSASEKIQVLHVTGDKNHDSIAAMAKNKNGYLVFKYMHDIADAYAASDVLICRSGAGAVFEIKALNKPAILVPYPYATGNHQFYNAKAIEKPGLVEVIEEKNINPEVLISALKSLKANLGAVSIPKIAELPQEIIFKEITNV